jgi:hypothetical protein
MAKRKRSNQKKTKHHIIPSSRLNGKPILNVCKVEKDIHQRYHGLFGNMTPFEIVKWLNDVCWSNQFEISIKRKE